jgi:hypothetical protein
MSNILWSMRICKRTFFPVCRMSGYVNTLVYFYLAYNLMYKSSTLKWELIIYGTNQVHLSESWSFKKQIKYTSVRVDHCRNKSSTSQSKLIMINSLWDVLDVYLKWSTHSEVYLIYILNHQLTLRCTWLVPTMINSHWGVLDLFLKGSTLTEVYLICIHSHVRPRCPTK